MTPHGGYRPGSGRKRKPVAERLVTVPVKLSLDAIAFCRKVGAGKTSAGIRQIVAGAMALAKAKRKGE